MTVTEAFEKLGKVFPGKQSYVQCMRWRQKGGAIDEHYTFAVCVYDVDGRDNNISVSSITSLEHAVTEALSKRPSLVEGDEIFATATATPEHVEEAMRDCR